MGWWDSQGGLEKSGIYQQSITPFSSLLFGFCLFVSYIIQVNLELIFYPSITPNL